MARLGGHDSMGVIIDRPGPAFCAAPVLPRGAARRPRCTASSPRCYERERSGRGPAHRHHAGPGLRRPRHLERDASATSPASTRRRSRQAALADDGASVPNNSLFFRLLVALSADGRWLQFSQTTPRLFAAFMRVLELDWMFDDPAVVDRSPTSTTSSSAHEYFERLLAAVRVEDRRGVAGGVRPRARRVGRDLPPRQRAARPPADGARPTRS